MGIVDLYVGRPAPTSKDFDLAVSPYVFLKGTVNTNCTGPHGAPGTGLEMYPDAPHVDCEHPTVDQYIEAFQPDIKLLFVRHPEHNLASLKKKFYAPVAGSMDGKVK